MHSIKSFSHLVKAPADEIFTELTWALQDDVSERATFHKLEDEPDAPLELINLVTVNQLLAI